MILFKRRFVSKISFSVKKEKILIKKIINIKNKVMSKNITGKMNITLANCGKSKIIKIFKRKILKNLKNQSRI